MCNNGSSTIKTALNVKGKRPCGNPSVFLKTDGFEDGVYDLPKRSIQPTFRKVIERYLQDVKAAPFCSEDEVYIVDTSDFAQNPGPQLLKPSQLDEPVRLYDEIVIQRKGDNKS